MEIAPVPHRTTRSEWRRLAYGLLVLTPVVLLVLLPAVLGLDRYVVTDTGATGASRGSVVLAQEVAPSDLETGDVISFRRSDADGAPRLTREVVGVEDGLPTVAGGVQVPPHDTYARVWLGVPWIGYPFVVDGGWVLLLVLAVGALTVALLVGRRRPARMTLAERLPRPRLPVG